MERGGESDEPDAAQAIAGEAAAPTGRLTAETWDWVRLLLDHVGIDPALVRT